MWSKLYHNGVDYQSLYSPHGIKIKYNGKLTNINPEIEEIFTILCKNRYHIFFKNDKVFTHNFKKSFKQKNFTFDISLFDFEKYAESLENVNCNQIFKSSSIKFKYHKDGEIININNRVEPTSIFIGRGKHPLRGTIKSKIGPKDIVLNMSMESKSKIHVEKWKQIVEKKDCNWIAQWTDPVTQKIKYIHMNNENEIKRISNVEKFDFANKFGKTINSFRNNYENHFKTSHTEMKDIILCVYLIDRYLIRVGNDSDYSNTSGCCTLKKKNFILNNNNVTINMIGKDSIPYSRTLKMNEPFYSYLKYKLKNILDNEYIFSKTNPDIVNRYLNKLYPGLTAKVFRTCHANKIMKKELNKSEGTPELKLKQAFKTVAIACNHKVLRNNKYIYSTSTCKNNYIDSRIIREYCLKNNLKYFIDNE